MPSERVRLELAGSLIKWSAFTESDLDVDVMNVFVRHVK